MKARTAASLVAAALGLAIVHLAACGPKEPPPPSGRGSDDPGAGGDSSGSGGSGGSSAGAGGRSAGSGGSSAGGSGGAATGGSSGSGGAASGSGGSGGGAQGQGGAGSGGSGTGGSGGSAGSGGTGGAVGSGGRGGSGGTTPTSDAGAPVDPPLPAGQEPCTPEKTLSGGQSGNFNTMGAFCFRTPDDLQGWGCSNFDGRTVRVNGKTMSCGALPLPAKINGYIYFDSTAGTYPWASIHWWGTFAGVRDGGTSTATRDTR